MSSDADNPIPVNRSKRPYAPSDEQCSTAWDQIAALARDHCLVLQAASGVMTIVTPEEQRSHNLRNLVLDAHLMQETLGHQGGREPADNDNSSSSELIDLMED